MPKIELRIASFIFVFILGILPILGFKTWSWTHGWRDSSLSSSYFAIGIGVILFVLSFKKPKTPQVTKCPKCKDTFNYKDTLDGKCPNCKDVDTMDIKEYYEKFPDEKKE